MSDKLSKEEALRIFSPRLMDNMPEGIGVKIFYPKQLDKYHRRRVIVTVNVGNKIFYGMTSCSVKDNFNKKLGRDIAMIRACRNYWKVVKADLVQV